MKVTELVQIQEVSRSKYLGLRCVLTQLHWDGPTENIIYLGHVANMSTEKNPLKNLGEEKL